MKKIIALLIFASIGFISCNKEDHAAQSTTENLSPQNATVVATGALVFASKTNGGSVKIYKQPNGKYLLGLEGMSVSAEHSLVIYLSNTQNIAATSVKICSVATLQGNVYRELPAHINIADFRYLVIQTEPWEETIAVGELK